MCLRPCVCACTRAALFVSVESNSRLKGESISIFAMHFYTIAACPAVFEKQRMTDGERGREWRDGCWQREDCSFRFDVEAKMYLQGESVYINAPGIFFLTLTSRGQKAEMQSS